MKNCIVHCNTNNIELVELTPEEIAQNELNKLAQLEYLRLNDYKQQRAEHYPSMYDYLDAKVKQASLNEDVRNDGLAQENRYITQCLSVKALYPKPW